MALSKFLDPKNDLAFKRIFGTEKNKDILIHFLNDIFGRTTNPIENVTFLKTAQNPEVAALRESIVDVLCEDLAGNRFIIEMQVDSEPGFEKRAQYYAAKAYIEQREKKTDDKKDEEQVEYKDLKEVIFLGITNFTLLPDHPDYLSHHVMLEKKTHVRHLKGFSFSFLELPKFKKKKNELTTIIEKWAYFFKNAKNTTKEDLALIIGSDLIIQRAYEELESYGWSPEELRAYDSVEMKQGANKAVLEGALDQGREEGKKERDYEIARLMLQAGESLEKVEKFTGLTRKELKGLISG